MSGSIMPLDDANRHVTESLRDGDRSEGGRDDRRDDVKQEGRA